MLVYIYYVLAIFSLPVVKASSGWDDFANNLATDLAPFLSLFGEQVTKQYLSESTTFLDYFIFAMAPMGIMTGLVSAIRVCGSSSLRAFVGRAQEGIGNAEAELCSSTSRDVCELYNKGGIARVFGRPKILEIVYDPDYEKFGDGEEAGIYTFAEYLGKNGKGEGKWERKVAKRSNKPLKSEDTEKRPEEEKSPFQGLAPNLSLNIGIAKQPPPVFWIVAFAGFVLQAGVLVFAATITYFLKWKKDGKPQDSYACPLVITGTLLVCGGMFLCAFLVGQSTQEVVWRRKKKKVDENSSTSLFQIGSEKEENVPDKSFIYWLQLGGQIIGDQTFDAFVHAEDCSQDKCFEEYIISWKKPSEQKQEYTVWAACGITIPGFILQFTGLRGMHSAVSVAQLGIILVMSLVRAALRMKRLNNNSFAGYPDEVIGHELDWLAMQIGRDNPSSSSKSSNQSSSSNSLLLSNYPRYFWKFCPRLDFGMDSTAEDPSGDGSGTAAKSLAYRSRLADLTAFHSVQSKAVESTQHFNISMVEVRRSAQQLATAMLSAMNAISKKDEHLKEKSKPRRWFFACETYEYMDPNTTLASAKNRILSALSLHLDQDTKDATGMSTHRKLQNNLEGILGLWVWSIKIDPAVEEYQQGQYTISRAAEIPTQRIVSTSRSIAEIDLNLWLPDQTSSPTEHELPLKSAVEWGSSFIWLRTGENSYVPLPYPPPLGVEQVVRFFGWYAAEPFKQAHTAKPFTIWSVPTQGSLSSLCAQDIFGSFVKSIVGATNDIGEVTIKENHSHFRLSNPLVSDLVKSFTESQLGSESDALLCIIPAIISQLKLSSLAKALTAAKKSANHYWRQKDWTQAQATLQWAWKRCIEGTSSQGGSVSIETLIEEAAIALGELYRFALCDPDTKTNNFGITGIEWLENQKSNNNPPLAQSSMTIIDRYCEIKKVVKSGEQFTSERIQSALECKDLQETLTYVTLMGATMTSDQKGACLCLAARRSWTEVVFCLLELAAEPNYRDSDTGTALSYAAQNGNVEIVKDLLERGVFTNPEDNVNMTPMLYAVKAGHISIVESLLQRSPVLLNLIDKDGRTPLWHAAYNGHESIVQILLKKDAEVNIKSDEFRETPLSQAAKNGHERIVQMLLEKDAEVNIQDRYHKTPLYHAAVNKHERIVQMLLEKDAEVNIKSGLYQETPLYHAAVNGDKRIVQMLLEKGAEVNIQTSNQETPLYHAAANGYERIVQMLLDRGARVDIQNGQGHTPLSMADARGHKAIAKLLRDYERTEKGT